MKIERLFVIIFGGAAIPLLAGAAFWGYMQNQFLKNSHRATGFVTRLERRESSKDGRTTYLYFPGFRRHFENEVALLESDM